MDNSMNDARRASEASSANVTATANADPTAPKTGWFLYVLGALVVLAVWLTYRWSQSAGSSDLDRWARQELSVEAIEDGLKSTASDAIGHALVQLQLQSLTARDAEPDLAQYEGLAVRLPNLVNHDEVRIRRLVAYAAGHVDAPASREALRHLVADAEEPVRLVAAMGLANFNDAAGATVLADALDRMRPEERRQRREVLNAFRFVAQSEHLELLRTQLRIARLDGDEAAKSMCEWAIRRLGEDPSEE